MSQSIVRVLTAHPANHPLIAQAVRRIATWLDAIDDGAEVVIGSELEETYSEETESEAWLWAALLIADMCEVDSVSLRAMAVRIDKGVQGVL